MLKCSFKNNAIYRDGVSVFSVVEQGCCRGAVTIPQQPLLFQNLRERISMDLFVPYRMFVGSFLPNCLLRYPNLSSSAKLLWARLSQYSGEKGYCWPKQEVLAEEIGLSSERVRKLLKELETEGFIKVERPSGVDRLNHAPNKYYFVYHEIFRPTQPGQESGEESGGKVPPVPGANDRPAAVGNALPITITEKGKVKENKKLHSEMISNTQQVTKPAHRRTIPPGAVSPPTPKKDTALIKAFPVQFLDSRRLMNTWDEFVSYRKQIKSPIRTSNVGAKLVNLSNGDADLAVAIMQQSMANEWRGLFDIKGDSGGANKFLGKGNKNTDSGKYAGIGKVIQLD